MDIPMPARPTSNRNFLPALSTIAMPTKVKIRFVMPIITEANNAESVLKPDSRKMIGP